MTKAKATKLDKEIQEGLYDPKSHQKAWEKELKAKAHEGKKLKGQQRLTSAVSTSKRLSEFAFDIKGIADSLRRQGIEPDLIDIEAEYDHNLSHSENLKRIKSLIGARTKRSYRDYSAMQKQFYRGTGKLINASPEERAAAFAQMRADGTLRGYDPINLDKLNVIKGDTISDKRNGKHYRILAIKRKYVTIRRVNALHDIDANNEITISQLLNDFEKVILYKDRKGINHLEREAIKAYDPKTLSSPPSRWYEAMVKGIKRSSDVRNPYAIVKSIWSKLSPSKKAEIKRREAKGERFKYNLPLPVDKPTRGTGTVRMVKPFKLAEVQVNLSVKDYLSALKSGIFSRMKRQDGTTALVARCKSPDKNVNIFVDKAGK